MKKSINTDDAEEMAPSSNSESDDDVSMDWSPNGDALHDGEYRGSVVGVEKRLFTDRFQKPGAKDGKVKGYLIKVRLKHDGGKCEKNYPVTESTSEKSKLYQLLADFGLLPTEPGRINLRKLLVGCKVIAEVRNHTRADGRQFSDIVGLRPRPEKKG